MFRIVILGSGASLPTLQRQCSALALQRDGEVFLVDCGEGTQLQWRRAGLRFGKLRGICISHLHGDHVNGLVGLLQTLSLADRIDPLILFGPPGVRDYIAAIRRYQGVRLGYRLEELESTGGILHEGDGYRLECRLLDHGPPTLGYALIEEDRPGRFDVDAARRLGLEPGPDYGRLQAGESVVSPEGEEVRAEQVLGPCRPGRRIAYCVDTRPCESVIKLACNADLLICDSTFADDLSNEARKRGHCTAVQAAEMARTARARKLVLTHISARYHDTSALLAEARVIFPETTIAEDLMDLGF